MLLCVFVCLFWCTDVDECSERLHNCDENANCTNLDEGFNCTCNSGYSGNGTFCSGMKMSVYMHTYIFGQLLQILNIVFQILMNVNRKLTIVISMLSVVTPLVVSHVPVMWVLLEMEEVAVRMLFLSDYYKIFTIFKKGDTRTYINF